MKPRKVDVVGVEINYLTNDNEKFSFEKIIQMIEFSKSSVKIKTITIELFKSENEDYIVGIVKTSQNKEVPPLLDHETNSMRKIHTKNNEGLGYANVFLYDKKLQILLYEMNKDGCYLNDLKQHINICLAKLNKNVVNIDFPIILKKDDVVSVVNSLNRVTKLITKIYAPNELKREIESSGISTSDAIKNLINNPSGATVLKQEYLATNKKINPNGLKSSFISQGLDLVSKLRRNNLSSHFEEFKIEGYTQDPDGENVKRVIDYFENTYREIFKIESKNFHQNLQETERKNGIISVYDKIKNSLYRDYYN
ncbi:hypothetical protein [Empedobacter stercoris]|uniref:Uncharacterized protein n=1 Tax=Empedobacter stercoris TaxID=1628248 RepID=A0ABX1WLB6_9FLAO|nr:hypothetical protein [Empedobacter stercoris]NOJ75476.1 hypothetical protein [Empedobacter stercoris]